MTSDPPQEDAVHEGILSQLISRHSGWVPEDDIRRTFEECLAQFSSARIRDFVPVLAHRCAREKLRAMATEMERQEKVRMTERLEPEVRTEVSVHKATDNDHEGWRLVEPSAPIPTPRLPG